MIVQGSWNMNKYDTNPPNTSRFFGEILQKVPVTCLHQLWFPLKMGWDMVAFNDPCLNWWGLWCPKLPLGNLTSGTKVTSSKVLCQWRCNKGFNCDTKMAFCPSLRSSPQRWMGFCVWYRCKTKRNFCNLRMNVTKNKRKTPNLQIAWKKQSWKNQRYFLYKTDRLGANVIFVFFTWLHQLWPEGIISLLRISSACLPCPKNHWTLQWRGLNLYSRGSSE